MVNPGRYSLKFQAVGGKEFVERVLDLGPNREDLDVTL
jgi:hypothetical protein